jgi:hypothetical protein
LSDFLLYFCAHVDDLIAYDYILSQQLIPQLSKFLEVDHHATLQMEAAWVFTNLACGGQEFVSTIVGNNVVQLLVRLVQCAGNFTVQEQALWALGNLSVDSCSVRQLMLECGIISTLLNIVGAVSTSPIVGSAITRSLRRPGLLVSAVTPVEPSLSTVKHVAWICCNLAW